MRFGVDGKCELYRITGPCPEISQHRLVHSQMMRPIAGREQRAAERKSIHCPFDGNTAFHAKLYRETFGKKVERPGTAWAPGVLALREE